MGRKNIIKVQPKRIKKDHLHLLSVDDLSYIQKVLEQSCIGDVCLSRSQLYEELKGPMKLDIEQYQFEQALTSAIKNKRIIGFETRSGRTGGICRVGAFSKKSSCTIAIGAVIYDVPVPEEQANLFLTQVLNAIQSYTGNIVINQTKYILLGSLEKYFINYIIKICSGVITNEKVDNSN